MSFINIIKMTGTNRNFFTESIFISGERYEDYILIFFTIRKLYNIYKLRYPSTFVTNTCPKFKRHWITTIKAHLKEM